MSVRRPAVAGSFYPADPRVLEADCAAMLSAARETARGPAPAGRVPAGKPDRDRPSPQVPRALVLPHAGYVYSGPVAARGYALLVPWFDTWKRVLLLGPCHRTHVRGMALSGASGFSTPLGTMTVDQEACAALSRMGGVETRPEAHEGEHSLEVQVPFLQMVLGHCSLVPVLVGHADPRQVAAVIEALWNRETLVIVSSDLSHFLDARSARARDSRTLERILSGAQDIGPAEACGAAPLNGFLLAAGRLGLKGWVVDARNSADTAGSPERVVGYAALAWAEASHG